MMSQQLTAIKRRVYGVHFFLLVERFDGPYERHAILIIEIDPNILKHAAGIGNKEINFSCPSVRLVIDSVDMVN